MSNTKPTDGNGKICYLEIPATDIDASANFYSAVFGWKLRRDSEGHVSFDDGVGQVSGTWVTDKKPMIQPGIIISIMVDDAEATSELVRKHGGKIVYSNKMESGEVIVHFIDPGGNYMGIYKSS